MEKTIREQLQEGFSFYTRHADWEQQRADQATAGSEIQRELREAAAFNRGRADAYKEIMEQIFGIM